MRRYLYKNPFFCISVLQFFVVKKLKIYVMHLAIKKGQCPSKIEINVINIYIYKKAI